MGDALPITCSLEPLRTIVESLKQASSGQVPAGTERRKMIRAVKSAGNAAVPALLRAFCSSQESESSWAYFLLGRLGGERVVRKVGELLEDPGVEDAVKARALGLLSDLHAPVPAQVRLKDPEALLARSVKELLASLDGEGELEQAVELIRDQVPEPEMPAFVGELVRHGGRRAAPIVALLAADTTLGAATRAAMTELHRQASATRAERAVAEALDRGLEYLEAGRPRAALKRLERVVTQAPDHAEGRSALGVCLLQLGDAATAVEHLRQAARLDPEEALHAWNLAAAAKQADRMGGAYLALREYLERLDDTEGAQERRREARAFVRAYEKMLRESHPGVSLADYLRGEELFARAYAALADGHAADAVRGFEAVIALVPRHYPSWGNLGAAFLQLGRRDEAHRALDEALRLNPDYALARKNLSLL